MNLIQKIAFFLLLLLGFGSVAYAAPSVFATFQGGTGTSTPSGILYGSNDQTQPLKTVTIGSNLTFSGGTLSATGGGTGGTGVATTSLFATAPIFVTKTAAAITFSWFGLSTTTQPSSSNLLTSNGSNGVYGTATSTLSATSPLTGSFVQVGSGGSLGIQAASASQAGSMAAIDWQLLHTATTTFSSPLVYTLGTNAVTCPTCNTSSASVTSITGGTGLSGGTITTSGTFALKNFLATSTADTANQVLFFTSTNATPATFGGSTGLTFDGTKLTFNYASSTLFSTFAGGITIPNAASTTLSVTGQLAMNTTAASSSLNYYDGAKDVMLPDVTDVAFSYINYPTSGTGTSTFQIKGGPRGRVFVSGGCSAKGAGTAVAELGNGLSATTTPIAASSAGTNNITFSSNNTFQAWQDVFINIGTFSSTGTTTVSCSYGKRYLY